MKLLLLICFLIPMSSIAQDSGNIDSSKILYQKKFYDTSKNVGTYFESLNNLAVEKGIITELEAKEAQIQILTETVEANRRIIGVFIFLIMLMVYAIYFLYQNRLLFFIKEKNIEVVKRANIELELESKKRELTTKILQLTQKNEVLGIIETEISSLKSNTDNSVSKTYSRIKSLIEHNTADEKQWEQFSTEFSSLHQEFIKALVINYGEFSKSEIRLISLLKMNLSSKEIAETLNISDEGVKKARYRLRKKLNLESENDLQGFLLSFS